MGLGMCRSVMLRMSDLGVRHNDLMIMKVKGSSIL
jgi:hypothetical protein